MAENVFSRLRGVCMVVNQITVRSRSTFYGISTKIEDALKRHAENEAKEISLTANSDAVTLRGRVARSRKKTSLAERLGRRREFAF